MRRTMVAALVLGLSACGDTDQDGLSNQEERELGLDPTLADTDGDGLMDGDELALGTDPLQADTDGDGLDDGREIELETDPLLEDTDADSYLDYDEVIEGTDPLDASSLIYEGGWPYFRDKAALGDPGLDTPLELGGQVGRFVGVDQHGDEVDLYDLAGSDVPIVLDVSATWCAPCNELSAWLSGDRSLDDMYPGVRRAVKRGDVRWVTLMVQDAAGMGATGETCEEWDEEYPHSEIPVIADGEALMAEHLGVTGLPTLRLLDPDLRLSPGGAGAYWEVLNELSNRLER